MTASLFTPVLRESRLFRFARAIFSLLLAIALPSAAQPPATDSLAVPQRAEILVLGTYHMANPGRDVYNMQVDDVLSAKRQVEISELIEVLKKFRPTKIAVESNVGSDRVPKAYADYLVGKHALSRNEIEQIGFRLAKSLGHGTVYPVDVDGEFPYGRIANYARANGRSEEFDAIGEAIGRYVKTQNDYLASNTLLQTLLLINSDPSVAEGMAAYYRFAHLSDPNDWAGADLNAEWYRRNIRIYSNIARLARSPDERILVVYGAGHLGWLQHSVASDPKMRLRKLSEFAP
jgi:Family of unknown function (DUF5694)